MKLIGRTLAVLAAAMVVVGFWLAIGALTGSTATAAGAIGGHDMGEHGMEAYAGFQLTTTDYVSMTAAAGAPEAAVSFAKLPHRP